MNYNWFKNNFKAAPFILIVTSSGSKIPGAERSHSQGYKT